jgi:nitrate reductase gamma subunit
MDLLAFAKGPALAWSIAIFIFGVVWRLVGVFLLRGKVDLSAPRTTTTWKGLRLIVLRFWPRKEFLPKTFFNEIMGYAFHLGFFIALFFYLPHLLFFRDIFGVNFKDLFGVAWPYLPGGIVYFVSAIAVASLLVLLIHRLTNPVKRLISNFDDYFSWFVTMAPLVTGMLAFSHLGGPYQTLLALHILSVELLLIWFPFGKLMHVFTIFVVRGVTGVLFEHKGATL